MEASERAHVIIHGRVQGVFFRMETQKAARQYGVTGWVRNLPDGTVEAVVEGPPGAVASLLEWCGRGPRHSRVDKLDITWEPFEGEYDSFEVTY